MLTILDGSTFCVSDDLGDVGRGSEGLYAADTRMLSKCRLVVDGASPLLLTSRAVDYFNSVHYVRNAPTARLPQDSIFIARERFIGESLTERLVVSNECMSRLHFDLVVELASDFASILSVKATDFAFGDPLTAPILPAEIPGPRPSSE